MKKKHKIKKINGVKVAVEINKWEEAMKPRVPATKSFKDGKHFYKSDRNKAKVELKVRY